MYNVLTILMFWSHLYVACNYFSCVIKWDVVVNVVIDSDLVDCPQETVS